MRTPSARPALPPSRPAAATRPFLLLCTMGFAGRLSYEMLRTPITALYATHLGAPLPLIGLLVSAVTITGIVVKLPSGVLADLFGTRRLMRVGLLVKASAPLLYFVAVTWPVLLLVRLYHGLSTALYAPAAAAEVAALFPEQRGRRLGIYGGAENAGVVLGPVLGAAVLSVGGFDAAFIVSALIGLLALALIHWYPAPIQDPGSKATDKAELWQRLRLGVEQILGNRAIRRTSLVEGSLYAGVGTLQAYLPIYALMVHVSVPEVGLILAAQGVTSILVRPIAGSMGDRLGRRPFIVAGVLVCAGVVMAVPHAAGLLPLLLLSLMFGMGTGLVTPSTTALIGDVTKRESLGAAMGVFGSLWDIGHAAGPLLAGPLIATMGYSQAFAVIAAVMVVALAIFVLPDPASSAPRR